MNIEQVALIVQLYLIAMCSWRLHGAMLELGLIRQVPMRAAAKVWLIVSPFCIIITSAAIFRMISAR